jgi:hypothetical protein
VSQDDERVEESDPGFLGGGSVAEETEPEDPESEEMYRPDTDHDEWGGAKGQDADLKDDLRDAAEEARDKLD